MGFAEFGWKYSEPEIDEEQINEIEKVLFVQFPLDYKICAKKYHGGSPVKRKFTFHDKYGCIGSLLGGLLSLNQDSPEYIVTISKYLQDQGFENIIPFAINGGGDYICFDYRNKTGSDAPEIVYWNHEESGDDAIVFLSNTFYEFLQTLQE